MIRFAFWKDSWCQWAARLQYDKADDRETYESGQVGDRKHSGEWWEQWD